MKFYRNKALRPYNTLALQAYAEAFVTVTSDAELVSALAVGKGTAFACSASGTGQ